MHGFHSASIPWARLYSSLSSQVSRLSGTTECLSGSLSGTGFLTERILEALGLAWQGKSG